MVVRNRLEDQYVHNFLASIINIIVDLTTSW